MYPNFVNLPNTNTLLLPRILNDSRFFPYFKDCLSALDRTYIPIQVPLEEQPKYRNWKGFLLQNVLAVCNFNLSFVYLLPSWEGSMHDSRVLVDVQLRHGFVTPTKKY